MTEQRLSRQAEAVRRSQLEHMDAIYLSRDGQSEMGVKDVRKLSKKLRDKKERPSTQ